MRRRAFFQAMAGSVLSVGGSAAIAQSTSRAENGELGEMSGKLQSAWRFGMVRGPLTVGPGPHLFSDWRWVAPGVLVWRSGDGEPAILKDSGPFGDFAADHDGIPQGIVVRVQPATISGPVEKIWPGTLIYENGTYRLWYAIQGYRLFYTLEFAGRDKEIMKLASSWVPVLLYAESKDGFDWKLPDTKVNVGQLPWKNAVYGGKLAGERSLDQPGVFRDPVARAAERYKMVYGGDLEGAEAKEVYQQFRTHRPNDLDPKAIILKGDRARICCLFGATSPDGLRWSPVKQPLALHNSDTANTAYYDEELKKYVWYGRINTWFRRRAVGRSETDDFTRFPYPDIVIRPVASDLPSVGWYTNGKTQYPGTVGEHLIFSAEYRLQDESSGIHLFASPDGIHWDQIPGGPVIVQGPHGRPNDCWIRAWGNVVPLQNDQVGLLCDAELLPHKYPRRAGQRYREIDRPVTFWALWPRGRLSAIEANGYGVFETPPLKIAGKRLVLNVQTKRAGEVLVEVARASRVESRPGTAVSPSARPPVGGLPGRSFVDCDPIRGDSLAHTVTWRGKSEIGVQEDIVFRFRMRMAKLFSFEIV